MQREHATRYYFIVGMVAVAFIIAGSISFIIATQHSQDQRLISPVSSSEPRISVETVASELQKPWDVTVLPDETIIFTENSGTLKTIKNGVAQKVADIAGVNARGEGGLMGLAVDPKFSDTNRVYLCYNTENDIRVVSWKLNNSLTGVSSPKNIVTGIDSNESGRHSGCRAAFDDQNNLWIGTGDAAQSTNPQNLSSLAGKIIKVDRNGNALKSSPFLDDANADPRIFSYGHRNTQGLALFSEQRNGIPGYSVEHGSSIDDEVNPLVSGNFGWNPKKPYVESGVSMTDLTKFPNAIEAVWSSGKTTEAPSGATIIQGEKWKSWDGAIAIAMLKAKHIKILTLSNGKVAKEFQVLNEYGRIRDVEQSRDGSLYVTTDNGGGRDVLLKITPKSE